MYISHKECEYLTNQPIHTVCLRENASIALLHYTTKTQCFWKKSDFCFPRIWPHSKFRNKILRLHYEQFSGPIFGLFLLQHSDWSKLQSGTNFYSPLFILWYNLTFKAK